MSKPKIVSDYLDAAVPKGLTESRRKLLTDELESHIYDKAEHYMEIGYSEKKSFEKAVTEMGDAEPVRESFEKLYKESWIINTLIVLGAIPLNFLATVLGFDYAYFGHTWDILTPIYVFISTALASVSLLSILHLYKKRKENRLIAVAVACGLSLLSLVLLGSVFQPLFYSLTQNGIYIIERLKNVELLYTKILITADSDIFETAVNIGSVLLLLFLGILSFTLVFQCEKKAEERQAKNPDTPGSCRRACRSDGTEYRAFQSHKQRFGQTV
ncbi:MAG: permease prefix domain 1-containing protein [Oscillospiraceae bacterium]|nr:permease prefix domain 1-containing protein [Oscillospiraceae bacterium]